MEGKLEFCQDASHTLDLYCIGDRGIRYTNYKITLAFILYHYLKPKLL